MLGSRDEQGKAILIGGSGSISLVEFFSSRGFKKLVIRQRWGTHCAAEKRSYAPPQRATCRMPWHRRNQILLPEKMALILGLLQP
jgi:hypothetical protein